MSRSEMLEKMDASEIAGWMAYAQLHPFDSEDKYRGPAIGAAAIINFLHAVLGGEEAIIDWQDLIPRPESQKSEEKPDIERTLGIVSVLNALYGGKDLRKNHG